MSLPNLEIVNVSLGRGDVRITGQCRDLGATSIVGHQIRSVLRSVFARPPSSARGPPRPWAQSEPVAGPPRQIPQCVCPDFMPKHNQASRYLYRSARTELWERPQALRGFDDGQAAI